MTRWLLVPLGLIGFLLLLPAETQAQTSFSGRWTLMTQRSTVRLPNVDGPVIVSVLGSDFTIQQTPDRLNVTQANEHPRMWFVMLDGSDSRVGEDRQDIGARIDRTYRGEWQGETFVVHIAEVTTWKDGRTASGERTLDLTLNPDGTLRVGGLPLDDHGTMGSSVYRWLEAVE
jgi:hypothetical protein